MNKKAKIKVWIQASMIAVLSVLLLTNCSENTITDADGNVYTVVTIGKQVWMTENLKTTKYNDGTNIPNVTDYNEWFNLSSDAYCWYNNDINNGTIYGALYNWYAVNTGKLCPVGWHVPTDAEWTELIYYLGGEHIAGSKLKEIGTIHWKKPNTGATNETCFTALPGGFRSSRGAFVGIGSGGLWWSATESNATYAWNRYMGYYGSNVTRDDPTKEVGFSVRCVRD